MVLHHKVAIVFWSFFSCFFKKRSQGLFLEGPAEILQKVWFWCYFRFLVIFKKMPLGRPFPQVVSTSQTSSYPERPCHDPVFHESTVITVPLGPTGFQKVAFWSKIKPFSFFLFLYVLILPDVFITIFHNNTVSVQPLSLPVFEKIAHISKQLFFTFMIFPFAFVFLFLISEYPLLLPWSRLDSLLIDVDNMLVRCW